MNYHLLGKSTLEISEIGFGCMSLKPGSTENHRLLHMALDYGINFFDTADLYDKGENEKVIGEILKAEREKVIIASKAGNQWRSDGSGWDWNPRKSYILSCCDESLRRLQTDYIDLYQLHGGTIDDPIDETIEAFEILKQQGKIRYYGISSIRPNVIREYVKRSNIVSVMMQYSLLDRRPEEEAFSLLKKNNIGILTRGSLAQGLLADKPPKPYLNYSAEEVKKASDAVKSVSSESRTPVASALKFVLQQPAVTSAITGIRTPEQLNDVIKTERVKPLTESEKQVLTGALTQNYYEQHR